MDSVALPLLIRLPRVDSDGTEYNYVLLHVSSAGDQTFDLKLIGTESTEVFSLKVKHHKTSEYKAKNFTGDQKQWEETLSVALLGAAATDFTKGVEAVAKVDRKVPSITINIQKRIEGITQKLGSITLGKTKKDDPDMFEWCGLTIKAKQDATSELADLREKLREKEEETRKLNDTLAELVSVKNAHEDDLAQKFSILLNEKKLKIRDQQRLLAAANVDPGKLEEVERNRIPRRDSLPEPSKPRKRKAGTAVKDESEESDDGYDKMDVDAAEPEPNSDEEGRQTEDEQSTADEDSEDDAPAMQLPMSNTNNAKASESGTASKAAAEPDFMIPPKRDLPFAKKPAPKPTAPAEGSETESDGDEL